MRQPAALETARELQVLHGDRLDVVFHGVSMDPLLFEGDIVIVEPVTAEALEIGDIVTYRYLDRYPTRRVVSIRSDRLVLWCDGWPERWFVASPADVLGRATARVRNGRRLDAASAEWIAMRERALRRYRWYRPRHLAKRAVGRVRSCRPRRLVKRVVAPAWRAARRRFDGTP